jgi:hypothetical protein
VKNEKNQPVFKCPVCQATAVEACKKPEKKESHECPRIK